MFRGFRLRRSAGAHTTPVGAARRVEPWHSGRVVKTAAAVFISVLVATIANAIAPRPPAPFTASIPSPQAVADNNTLGDDPARTPGRPATHTPPATAAATTSIKPVAAATAPHTSSPRKAAAPSSTPPHVMVIVEENKGYKATLGTCSADPYYCSLASTYATDTAWFGIDHPSAPNYVSMVSGSAQGLTSDCTPPSCGPFNVPSLGGQLTAAGIPWRAYMESMPSACAASGSSGLYGEKHNPFLYFTDVRSAPNCSTVDVPYPGSAGLVAALTGPAPPDFVWITPNLANDMHNGTVQQGDAWLKANLAPVLASSWFAGANATVIVTMDENDAQGTPGGGQVPMVVISSSSQGAGAVTTAGNHFGMLRSIEEEFGLGLLAGAASSANGDLTPLFGGPQ